MKKKVIIIVGIVIVIALVGGLVWYFVREDAETKIKHQEVETVYQGVESSKCTNIDYITENKNSDDREIKNVEWSEIHCTRCKECKLKGFNKETARELSIKVIKAMTRSRNECVFVWWIYLYIKWGRSY